MSCCNQNCCNKGETRQEKEYPEGIEPCCKISGPRCLCLPYDDPWVISAQILTIVATCISWVWWVTFTISVIGLTLFQLFWCLRMPAGGMYAHSAVAMVSALASLGVGIYCLIKWKYMNSCYPFFLDEYQYDDDWRWSNVVYQLQSDDDYRGYYYYDDFFDDDTIRNWQIDGTENKTALLEYVEEQRAQAKEAPIKLPDPDYCRQEVWGSIALVCFVLWMVAAVCMFYFVKSGRHAKWEAKHSVTSEDDAPAELEAVPSRDGGEEIVQADAAVLSSDKEDEVEEASAANV